MNGGKIAWPRLFLWALLAVAALAPPRPGYGVDELDAQVARVIDGDSIRLAGGREVRYLGIDAPEMRRRVADRWVLDPQPFAVAATEMNRKLVEGRQVRLEFDRERSDRYGRLLAYVYVDGTLVNEYLVRAGVARARPHAPNFRHRAQLAWAQAQARRQGAGIWGPEAP